MQPIQSTLQRIWCAVRETAAITAQALRAIFDLLFPSDRANAGRPK
jgi:hypothetical protein